MSRSPEAPPSSLLVQLADRDPVSNPEAKPTALELVIGTADRHLTALREQVAVLDMLLVKLSGSSDQLVEEETSTNSMYSGLVGEIETFNRGFGQALDDLVRKLARLGEVV